MRRHARPLALAGALALAAGVACGQGARAKAPVPALTSSPEAERAFEPLRVAWETHALDRGALAAFLRAYPLDGATPLATAYLAFAHLDAGEVERAEGLLAQARDARPGAARDLLTIARARVLRLRGHHAEALDLLRPLVGKVVDASDREVFLEEIALATIGARADYEAIAYLDAWLQATSEDDKARVRERVELILTTLPRPVLEATYRAMRTRGAASGYGPEAERLVGERLARVAVETNDAELARWLVEASGRSAQTTGGDAGVELSELASSRRGIVQVAGRAVALVLPTGMEDLRDEAADVARGVAWALGLPRRGPDESDGARLVTHDQGVDDDGMRAAFEEVVGDGASIVVAGLERRGAALALDVGARMGIPVIVLASPTRWLGTRGVVLGEPVEREIGLLADTLRAKRHEPVALVTDAREADAAAELGAASARIGAERVASVVACTVTATQAGAPRFPLAAWRALDVRGLVVSGSGTCARDILRELPQLGARPTTTLVGLTLESGWPASVPPGVDVVGIGAGIVPVTTTKDTELPDEDVRAYVRTYGAPPSYWTALGRDAGLLARRAVAALPLDTTRVAAEVARRRDAADAAVLAARARLWTTEATGVGPDRRVPRTLRVLSWERPAKGP